VTPRQPLLASERAQIGSPVSPASHGSRRDRELPIRGPVFVLLRTNAVGG